MAKTSKTIPAARIAQAALACALAVSLGFLPLDPLRAFAEDEPASALADVPEVGAPAPAPSEPVLEPGSSGDSAGADVGAPPAANDPANDPAADDPESPGQALDVPEPSLADGTDAPAASAEEPAPLSALDAAAADAAFDYGIVWGGVSWSVDAAGTLRLVPAAAPEAGYAPGQLPEVTASSPPPWAYPMVENQVKALQVEAGVKTGAQAVRLFANLPNLARVRAFNLDTSGAISLRELFSNCRSLAGTLDLSSCDTSQVQDFHGLFNECKTLQRVSLAGAFSTASATTLEWMFRNCNALEKIEGLGSFDTTNVASLNGMFAWCEKLAVIDVAAWNVSNVKDMRQVFLGCSSVEQLDLKAWGTGKAETFFQMFYRCVSLRSVELGRQFQTSGVKNVRIENDPYAYGSQGLGLMFAGCTSLASLDLSSFYTARILNMTEMLAGCTSLATIKVSWGFSWTGGWDPNRDAQDPDYSPDYFAHMLPVNSSPDFEGWRDEENPDVLYAGGCSGADIPSGLRTLRAAFKPAPLPDDDRQDGGTFGTSVAWDISKSTGLLRIYPANGLQGRFPEEQFKPWFWHHSEIKSVKVYPGVAAGSDISDMFRGYGKMVSCDLSGLDTSKATNASSMFSNCWALTSVDLSGLDFSHVTSVDNLFDYCTSLASVNLSGLDLSRATSMKNMFRGSLALVSVNFSNLDLSGMTSLENLFGGYTSLVSANFSGLRAPNVTTMKNLFAGCTSLVSADLSHVDASRAETLESLFSGCAKLASADLAGFKAPNVKRMGKMFYQCASLSSADLSSFDSSNLENTDYLFYGCASLASADLSALDNSRVTSQYAFFYDCASLVSVKVGPKFSFVGDGTLTSAYEKISLPSPTGAASASDGFERAYTGWWFLAELTVQDNREVYHPGYVPHTLAEAGWEASRGPATWVAAAKASVPKDALWGGEVTHGLLCDVDSNGLLRIYPSYANRTAEMPSGYPYFPGELVKAVKVYPGVVANGTMEDTFRNCKNMVSCDLSNLDTSRATSMRGLFANCTSLPKVDLSGFDTSRVADMRSMFSNCTSLVGLDLSNLDTSSATNLSEMFFGCSGIASLDLSGFDTSKVTDMHGMFKGCASLVDLDLSSFDTSRVTIMDEMFEDCALLVDLDLTSFSTPRVTDMNEMFYGCQALESVVLPDNFVGPRVRRLEYMFRYCDSLSLVPRNLTLPPNVWNLTISWIFEAHPRPGGELIDTFYAGSDPRILALDWERSNRRLFVIGGEDALLGEGDGEEGGAGTDKTAAPQLMPLAGARASAWQPRLDVPQVSVVVPESLTLSMDAAGSVSALGMRMENSGACSVRITALAPRLADEALPAGVWTLSALAPTSLSQAGGSADDAPESAELLAAKPFLKAAQAPYAPAEPTELAPGNALEFAWTGAFQPAETTALESAVAKAGGTLAYGTFEATVTPRPPEAPPPTSP